MREILAALTVAVLVWLVAGPAASAGDNLPDGNGSVPVTMVGGDNLPDGNG